MAMYSCVEAETAGDKEWGIALLHQHINTHAVAALVLDTAAGEGRSTPNKTLKRGDYRLRGLRRGVACHPQARLLAPEKDDGTGCR